MKLLSSAYQLGLYTHDPIGTSKNHLSVCLIAIRVSSHQIAIPISLMTSAKKSAKKTKLEKISLQICEMTSFILLADERAQQSDGKTIFLYFFFFFIWVYIFLFFFRFFFLSLFCFCFIRISYVIFPYVDFEQNCDMKFSDENGFFFVTKTCSIFGSFFLLYCEL